MENGLRRGCVGRWGKGKGKEKKKRERKLLRKRMRQGEAMKKRRTKEKMKDEFFFFEDEERDFYVDQHSVPQFIVEEFITKTAPHKEVKNGKALLALLSSRPLPKSSPLSQLLRYRRNGFLAGEMAKHLIKMSHIDVCDPGTGHTPLHYAVMGGARGAVKRLLKKGANPNAKNSFGQTPCHLAHRGTDISTLLKFGANITLHDHHDNPPFSSWLSRGFHPHFLPFFFSNSLHINYRSKKNGATLLHTFLRGLLVSPEEGWGVGECGLRMKASMAFFLKDFLKMFPRADPSIEDVEGVTPLCIALQAFHHLEMHWDSVFLLIKQVKKVYPKGYKENSHRWSLVEGKNGTNPLHSLVLTGFQDGVLGEELEGEMRRLIEDGVGVDQQDHNGNTPLHLAAQERRTNSVEILLKLGASVHIRNNEGETPLFVGVGAAVANFFFWHPNDLEALIVAGSDMRGIMGKTNWNWDLVKFLLSHGAKNTSLEEDRSLWDSLLGSTSIWRWGTTLPQWKNYWRGKIKLLGDLVKRGVWKERREREGFVEVLVERFVESMIGVRETGEKGGVIKQGGLLEMGEWDMRREGLIEKNWGEEDEREGEELFFGILDLWVEGGGEVCFSDVGIVELEKEVLGVWVETGEMVFCGKVLERILEVITGRCLVWVKGGEE